MNWRHEEVEKHGEGWMRCLCMSRSWESMTARRELNWTEFADY